MVCIGFMGYEAFDLILYTGRTLSKLNYRVLIIDLSGTGALNKAIPHGLDLDSSQDIVNFRDINYTRTIPTSEEMKAFREGVVLIVYGMKHVKELPLDCKQMNVVVNTFPNIIEKVNELLKESMHYKDRRNLVIRDVITVDDVDTVEKSLPTLGKFNRVDYLYLDFSDYESAVECQLTQVVRFTKISAKMKKYIVAQIQGIFPQLNANKINHAIKAARRGM